MTTKYPRNAGTGSASPLSGVHGVAGHAGSHRHRARGQRGVALVIALILLVVITLVGLAAIGNTLMQNKMASNLYDREVAFQSSEGALRAAQELVTANPKAAYIRDCSATSGNTCLTDPFTDPNFPSGLIQTVQSGTVPGQFSPGNLATGQPQFTVEYLGEFADPTASGLNRTANANQYGGGGFIRKYKYFLITARSGDPRKVDSRALVTLQSVVKL